MPNESNCRDLLAEFLNDPPEDFAILGMPSGDLNIFFGPFNANSAPVNGQSCIYFNDFFLSSAKPFFTCTSSISIQASFRKNAGLNANFQAPLINWSDGAQSEFLETFSFFRSHLKSKALLKAVPVSFSEGKLETSDLTKSNLSWLLRKLIVGQPGLYSYALKIGDLILLGASPEILFNLDSTKKLIDSEAVAGSIIATHAPLSEITGKLREEHDLVVNDLVNQLQKFGSVSTGEISLKSLTGISHLRTPLSVKASMEVDVSALIAAIHPSGALGILPRVALNDPFLKALDPSKSRRSFGAPFGAVFEDGSAMMLVAIRNLMFNENQVLLGAGAGITAQSEADSEFTEIMAKQHAVKTFFGLT